MIVSIEHCKNCSTHQDCQKKDEIRYQQLAQELQNKIQTYDPHIKVTINKLPATHKKYNRLTPDNKCYIPNQYEFTMFPRITSFEVYLGERLIFSKLLTKKWPIVQQILQNIKKTIEGKHLSPDVSQFDLSSEKRYGSKQQKKKNIKRNFRITPHLGTAVFNNSSKQLKSPNDKLPKIIQKQLQNGGIKMENLSKIEIIKKQKKKQQVLYNGNSYMSLTKRKENVSRATNRQKNNIFKNGSAQKGGIYPRNMNMKRSQKQLLEKDRNKVKEQNTNSKNIFKGQLKTDHLDQNTLQRTNYRVNYFPPPYPKKNEGNGEKPNEPRSAEKKSEDSQKIEPKKKQDQLLQTPQPQPQKAESIQSNKFSQDQPEEEEIFKRIKTQFQEQNNEQKIQLNNPQQNEHRYHQHRHYRKKNI